MTRRRWRWNDSVWKRTQSVVLWILGTAGIVNELFLQRTPRPEAWPIIAGLIGLPFAQAWDRSRQERYRDDPEPPAPKRSPGPSQSDPGARS